MNDLLDTAATSHQTVCWASLLATDIRLVLAHHLICVLVTMAADSTPKEESIEVEKVRMKFGQHFRRSSDGFYQLQGLGFTLFGSHLYWFG